MKKRNVKKDLFKHCKINRKESGKCSHACQGGCAYFLGFLGAAIYYIQSATSFWDGVLGVLKSLVWPAFLVHKLFSFLA